MNVLDLLHRTVESQASDLHLGVGTPPTLRIADTLQSLELPALTQEDMDTFIAELLDERRRKLLEENNEYDFALNIEGLGQSDYEQPDYTTFKRD